MTHSRPRIHQLLEENGLSPRRELGQNFVADPNTVRRIAGFASLQPGDLAIEIGPGLGSLTFALVETGADVVAVEVDEGLADVARSVLDGQADVLCADAQQVDWDQVIGERTGRAVLVANLPYNIGTTLVIDLLEKVPRIETLVVLVQTEVAERMVAKPNSKAYGIPSVLIGRYATGKIAGHVPPSVFVPRPKVQSSIVVLERHRGDTENPQDWCDSAALSAVLKAGFGQRRKMIRRSLGGLIDVAQLDEIGIDSASRPEQLSLEQWSELANLLEAK